MEIKVKLRGFSEDLQKTGVNGVRAPPDVRTSVCQCNCLHRFIETGILITHGPCHSGRISTVFLVGDGSDPVSGDNPGCEWHFQLCTVCVYAGPEPVGPNSDVSV